jgi:two-component system, chemotaxis family, protein-glutamate methylesterase/glutaminase
MAANLSHDLLRGSPDSLGRAARLGDMCIVIGISTGGPPALARLLAGLRPPVPPIVIVQHMPASFTGPLAERLNGLSEIFVREAADCIPLVANQALIAPGGKHLRVRRFGNLAWTEVFDGPAVRGHKPSIDVLMTSVADAFRRRCLGMIMTGMGHDGVAGCAAIRHAGGIVLGQDGPSSDVYGMNKLALTEGHVDRQFALENAAEELMAEIRALIS